MILILNFIHLHTLIKKFVKALSNRLCQLMYICQPVKILFYVVSFIKDLRVGNIGSCLERMRSFFASIPNQNNKEEKHYQTIFYLLFRLMGQNVDVEVNTAIGRADAVVKMQNAILCFRI